MQRHFFSIITILIGTVLISSCDAQVKLVGKFDSDKVGEAPALHRSGPPEGDFIRASWDAWAGPTPIVSSSNIFTNQVLIIPTDRNVFSFVMATFLPIKVESDYSILLTYAIHNPISRIRMGTDHIGLSFVSSPNRIIVSDRRPTSPEIGIYNSDEIQRCIITIYKSSQTYDLRILKKSGDIILKGLPIRSIASPINDFNISRPTMPPGNYQGWLELQSIIITEKIEKLD